MAVKLTTREMKRRMLARDRKNLLKRAAPKSYQRPESAPPPVEKSEE